jgi:hypothetical protein
MVDECKARADLALERHYGITQNPLEGLRMI